LLLLLLVELLSEVAAAAMYQIAGVTVYNGSPLLTASRALQQGHIGPCAFDGRVQGSCHPDRSY
jgi:hypothetical protein